MTNEATGSTETKRRRAGAEDVGIGRLQRIADILNVPVMFKTFNVRRNDDGSKNFRDRSRRGGRHVVWRIVRQCPDRVYPGH